MEDSITIRIANYSELFFWLIGIETIVFLIWIACLTTFFSWGSLIAFVTLLGVAIAHGVIVTTVPTVVTADSELLQYKHIFGSKKIWLAEIKELSCEQYTVRGRYNSTQRIKLVISTTSGDEFELHDFIDTGKLVGNLIVNKQVNVPIVQLYNFLKSGKALLDEGEL